MQETIAKAAVPTGMTWVARQGVELGYEKATGRRIPAATDLDRSLGSVLVYALCISAVTTVASVLATRWVTQHYARSSSENHG